METLKEYMESHRTQGVFYTHVVLHGNKGKFLFDRSELETFWTLYCNEIQKGVQPYIAEARQEVSPCIIDIDLKVENFLGDDDEKLYTGKQVESVIKIYQQVLSEVLQDCSDDDLTCVLLEKKFYIEFIHDKKFFKNGFHLHFPFCFLRKTDQESLVIPRVKALLKEQEIFRELGIEDSSSVLDAKASCSNAWLLYGSRKSDTSKPYLVTKIFDRNCNEISIEEAFEKYPIFNDRERLVKIEKELKYYLPRILSIRPWNQKEKMVRPCVISPQKRENGKRDRIYDEKDFEYKFKELQKLLPLLSDSRAEDRNEWMLIGWSIYNILEGSQEGLELWTEFSARCPEKFDDAGCSLEWEKMVAKPDPGMGTIKHFARLDNPSEYEKIVAQKSNAAAISFLAGGHADIAKMLYEEYGDIFVCAHIRDDLWYHFTGTIWEKDQSAVTLRNIIEKKIVPKFEKIKSELAMKLVNDEESDSKTVRMTLDKIINKISQLKSAHFRDGIMKECRYMFFNTHFSNLLDTNPYIFGFKNGVYDLKQNIFRKGRPDDYLSKTANCEYINYNGNEQVVHNVFSFLEQIFPDKSLRTYFLDIYSEIFTGGNHDKIVVFWTGDGDNGKTIMQQFFEIMLGPLAIKLNTAVITGKRIGVGAAFADLARAGGGVRWAVFEEPENDECINAGAFKHYSGSDSFFARDLYEKGKDTREIVPLFKLGFICNKLPRINGSGQAIWNRARVLCFESTFVREGKDCPETYEEQLFQKKFPRDKHFKKKIPSMISAFAWVLLEHRKKTHPRIEPEKVIVATEEYRKRNDLYKEFASEMTTEDEKGSIDINTAYSLFRSWYKDTGFTKTIARQEFLDSMRPLWGKPEEPRKIWRGVRPRTQKDDSDIIIQVEDEQSSEKILLGEE